MKNKERELFILREEAINYAESLKSIKPDNVRKQVLKLTHGKDISREVYLDSFPKARSTFYILGWRLEKIGDRYNLLKRFKELVKRKVDARIILTGSVNKKWELVRDYVDEGIKIKYLPLDNFSIFVLDAKECKITLKDRALMDKFNIQILDESFAKAMHAYFLECWEKAEDVKEFYKVARD